MNTHSSKLESGWLMPVTISILWGLCLVSAMGVVYATYQSRKATHTLEALRRQENGLQVISGQLMLERSSLATYTRVENIAGTELNMSVAEPAQTVLVYKR